MAGPLMIVGRELAASVMTDATQLADYVRDVGPAGFALFEPTAPFRVLSTNKAYLELLPEPFRSRPIVGLSLRDFIPDAEETGIAEVFREVSLTRNTRHLEEFPYTLADGAHWFNWTLAPVLRDGALVALANMVVDITREVRARKEAERARDENQRAAELLELGDPFCELDREFRVVRVNARQEQLTGVPRSQSVGKTHWELWPETGEPNSPWWREYHRCMTERVPVQFEDYYPPLDLWSNVTAYPTRAGGIAIFFRDITARKRDEGALEAERMRWRGVVEGIAEEVWVCDADGRMSLINLPDKTTMGLEEFRGKTYAEVLDLVEILDAEGRLRAQEDAPLLRSIRTGEIVRGEEMMRNRATGLLRYRQYSCAPTRDPSGAITGAVAIVRDVTAQRHAEKALREREAQFRALIEELHSGVALIDAAGKFSVVNRRFLEMFGLSSDSEIKNVNDQDWSKWKVHDEEMRLLQVDEHPVRKAALTGASVRSSLVGVRPPGRDDVTWMLVSAEPMRSPAGTIEQVVCTYHDITARKRGEEELQRAEAALQAANEQLREAARRKDEFLGMLSHELRNPLAPIRNSTYILRHAAPGSEQVRRAQTVIERQTDHLTRLVDDLLDVTRIARGKIELRRSRVDLREVVSRAADDFRLLLHDRGVEFRVVVPDASVWGDADATRVTQVVGNLLHNAAKFTRRGDEVTLSLRRTGDGAAEIRVTDTGAGIEAALLPEVFEPFVQGERTLARTEGGLGLGLALVKGIAELHGGTVRAASGGKGKGAEFSVTLPLMPAAATDAPHGATAVRSGRGRRVLVVDDNADAAESLAEIAALFGHVAEIAYDGPSAIERARANPPEIVLCDIGLPGMSGYEVARALRAIFGAEVQLFAVTGYAQPEDITRAIEAGFDGHVAKPPDPSRLASVLH